LPNRNHEEEIVRVCDICFNENKYTFPDLEERLKSKKWFTRSKSTTQDDEDGWDDDSDNSETEVSPSPRRTASALLQSELAQKLSSLRSESPHSIANTVDLQSDSPHKKNTNNTNGTTRKNGQYPSYSFSHKRPPMPPLRVMNGAPRSKSAAELSTATLSSSQEPYTSPLPPPNDDEEPNTEAGEPVRIVLVDEESVLEKER